MTDASPKVLILMGSDSDLQSMKACFDTLDSFGVPYRAHISSAHRSPERTTRLASEAGKEGIKVIVAAAGMAAHLAGVAAAHTTLPVIGVPMDSGALDGLDALLSTLQMPPGVPVAGMGIGSAGAVNAAVLAVQILALGDSGLAEALVKYKADLAAKVETKDKQLAEKLNA